MLPKKNRIVKKDFKPATGTSRTSNLFRVTLRSVTGNNEPKCSVIIPKKVAKTAIARNKLRRQAYRALQELWRYLPYQFIYIYPKKSPMKYQEIKDDLTTLLCLNK